MRLQTLGLRERVAPALVDVMQRRAWRERAHMLSVKREVEELLQAFRESGVTITLLKGVAFLHTGLRPYRACRDVDVLPAAEDMDASLDVLTRLGYAQTPGPWDPDEHHLRPYERPERVPVEVHTRVFRRSGAVTQDCGRTREVADGLRVLIPTDWCWHAIAHDAWHPRSFGRVHGALDAAALIDRYGDEIDWSVIAARASLWPDRVEPLLASIKRLGYDIPVPLPRRVAVLAAGLGTARDALAHISRSDQIFVQGTSRLSKIALRVLRADRNPDMA
jgi:hypothetical protein